MATHETGTSETGTSETGTAQSYIAEVLDRRQLSPHLMRIVLGGEGIRGFRSTGQPDEAVLLTLPQHEDGDCRWYSVRHVDGDRSITIDVALHESGIATTWARNARVGERVSMSGSKGWYKAPADASWFVLLADLTGLPAVGRILDELPAGVPVRAVIETPSPHDRLTLHSRADLEVAWLDNPDQQNGSSLLPAALSDIRLPDGPGYVWLAAETAATRVMRKDLRHERGLPHTAYSVVGYWRTKADEWLERYLTLPVDLDSMWQEAEKPGADAELIEDQIEAILERAGL